VAVRAEAQILQVLEEIFFLQGAPERLIERFLRSQEHIDEHTGEEEEDDDQGGEDLRDDTPAARLDIAKGPDDQGEP
jgi:hypothetical protein